MNIKMTWPFAGKIAAALFAGGFAGAWIGESAGSGVGICFVLIVVYVENEKQKPK